jgi:hypothetical protein
MRLIVGSLAAGVVIFLLIVLLAVRSGRMFAAEPWSVSSPITMAALAFAAMALILSFALPGQIARAALRRLPVGDPRSGDAAGWEGWGAQARELYPAYQTAQIVRAALLEGAAFFNVVAYMLGGTAPPLIAALVLVAAILAGFPTETGMRAWFDRAQAELSAGPMP